MLTKEEKYDKFYMDIALRAAQMSYAMRAKVGAVIVKEDNIISYSWNGTPPGFNNACEKEVISKDTSLVLETLPEVVHAEMNCVAKAAKSNESTRGATIYCTHMPCPECAKAIIQAGIVKVRYLYDYRLGAKDMFQIANIQVIKLEYLYGN